MQFYFIRHAQSSNNHLYATTGSSVGRDPDPELTTLGEQQAQLLAQHLAQNNFNLTHLYASLMVRALATGVAVSHVLGVPLVAWEDIHETGGIYLDDPETGTRVGQAGKNRSELHARFPDVILPATLGERGWWDGRPFEEREQRPARAERVLRDLLARHGNTDDRVAIISHGGFFNYLLAAILKMPSREAYWFGCHNVAITRIDFEPATTVVQYVNRIEWLPRELIT